LRLALDVENPALVIEAHHALGVSYTCEAAFVKAVDHLDQAIALYDPKLHASNAYTYGQDPAAICHIHAAHALWSLGYPDQAIKRVTQGLALGRQLIHPGNLATISAFAALIHQFCRNAEAVEELVETAVTLSVDHNFPFTKGMGTILRGWAATQLGREDGITQMQQGLDSFRVIDAVLMLPYFSSLLAQALGVGGHADEGLSLLASIDPAREPYWESELYRTKGELLLQRAVNAQDRHIETQAEQYFTQALTVARQQQAKSFELRASMSLARLWSLRGECLKAYNLIDATYRWFTEGFDTPDLLEANALIESLKHIESVSKVV
jgi:tetratricopeptide (TPR) repeat protein